MSRDRLGLCKARLIALGALLSAVEAAFATPPETLVPESAKCSDSSHGSYPAIGDFCHDQNVKYHEKGKQSTLHTIPASVLSAIEASRLVCWPS